MSYWEDESKFSGDTKEAIEELGSFQVDVNMSDLKYKVVNRKARKIDTKHSQYRTCPNIGEKKFSGKISLSYLALNDGHCNFSVVFRLENLRKLENANIDTGYHLITAVTAIIVAMAIILYIYLELFVFKRLQKMRRYVTRLSYTENSDDDEYDDVFASDYTSSEEQNNNSGGGGGGSSIAADDTKTKDEISRLKFMARKRLELLRCHHKDALASLTSQMDINAAVFESTKLVSLVRGRKQRPFFTHLPHYSHEKQQDFTVTKAFSIPPALELFKDYCARKDKEALLCIFFALDVAWLRSIEEAYPKHHGTYSPITVATARTVGRNYFANNSSAVCINFKKTTKSKVLKLNNYAPGMYDKALEEALAKIEAAFEKFKDTQEFLEMMYVSDVLHGTE